MTSSEQDALIAQAHTVFDSEYRRVFPQGGDAQDHDEAVQSAVAAVVEFVQADRTRRIVEWLRSEPNVIMRLGDAATRLEWEFGTQPEERAA